ncbi:hypothetical protein VTN49DRAFT_3925 [Thermomyces lanuginosus]|uniref:uncharacterized protein n=1 Tax=Thermomyces lanuginosus TaxID=5541 RepID=UPI003743C3ED
MHSSLHIGIQPVRTTSMPFRAKRPVSQCDAEISTPQEYKKVTSRKASGKGLGSCFAIGSCPFSLDITTLRTRDTNRPQTPD